MSTEWRPHTVAVGPGELFRGRFEYRVESRPPRLHGKVLEDWLNDYGSRGWQLCAVVEDEYGASEFFFKRELP